GVRRGPNGPPHHTPGARYGRFPLWDTGYIPDSQQPIAALASAWQGHPMRLYLSRAGRGESAERRWDAMGEFPRAEGAARAAAPHFRKAKAVRAVASFPVRSSRNVSTRSYASSSSSWASMRSSSTRSALPPSPLKLAVTNGFDVVDVGTATAP